MLYYFRVDNSFAISGEIPLGILVIWLLFVEQRNTILLPSTALVFAIC